MKVAFFHELHFGGARRVVGDYGKVFKKYHDVTLYYSAKKEEPDFHTLFTRSQFYKFESPAYVGGDWRLKIYKDFIEPIKLYFHHRRIARDIDRENFDFIFVHPSQFTHAPFLLRFLKTPTVYFCHEPLRTVYDPTVAIPSELSFSKKIYELISRKIKMRIDSNNIHKAKIVLANCKYGERNILKAYGIKSHVCYLAIDPELFRPLSITKKFDLFFVGDNIPMEGYDTLLQINALFGNKLRIGNVRKQKGKYITDSELVRLYNASKLVVVLGRFDPFSMIPLEAMACEVPPLVVKEGGPVEAVVDGVDGFLLPREPELFVKKIKELLSDDARRKKIGKNARKKVLSFWTWEESYKRLMEIIRSTELTSTN